VLANRHVANNYGGWIDIGRCGDLRPTAMVAADQSLTSSASLSRERIL
jgi:hypothetical protein